jgi:hypothetical protein
MNLSNERQIKKAITTKAKRWSAMITLIITLIIVTPFCGFLFQCGCDWPWSGLDARCNYYKPNAVQQCPWCASMITGFFSTGLAIIAGVWTTTVSLSITYQQLMNEVTIRTIFGVIIFILVGILTAGFAAQWQDYPLGIGSYLC